MTPVQNREEVERILIEHAEVLRAQGVKQIGLFGSVLRGEATPESDVDLLVDYEEGQPSWRGMNELYDILEDAFGRRVELISSKFLSPHFAPYILKEVVNVPLPSAFSEAHSQ